MLSHSCAMRKLQSCFLFVLYDVLYCIMKKTSIFWFLDFIGMKSHEWRILLGRISSPADSSA